MDIKSASKAHNAPDLKIDDRQLTTEYYEPAAILPSTNAVPPTLGGAAPSPKGSNGTPEDVSAASPHHQTSPAATRFPNGHGAADDHSFYESRTTGGGGATPSRGSASCRSRDRDRDRPPYTNGPTYQDSRQSARHGRSSGQPAGGGGASSGGGGGAGGGGGGGIGGQGGGAGTATTAGAVPTAAQSTTAGSQPWGYDGTNRYSSSTSQSDTGYSTTPSDNSDRRSSDQSSKKTKTKSRSGSRSPSPTPSTSSRSPSRSRSRSTSSSASSSSSASTAAGSGAVVSSSAAPTTSSAHSHQHHHHHHHHATATPTSTEGGGTTTGDRRPLAICVRNLPARSSDTSLKDGLYHEYKKHGKVTWVKVVGQDADRYAVVCFKKAEDVDKALEVSYDKLFFGCKIEVAPYTGCYDVDDNDARSYEADVDEYHPKATRTLFIGNLEKDVTASELRKHFDQFGEIIEIDIKKQGAAGSYAFCQYADIASVVRAIRKMDGEHLGNNRVKLGFGKSMPYSCVWVDGVGEGVTEKYLRIQFEPYGAISKIHVDRDRGQALVFYEQVLSAQAAVNKMRGHLLKNGGRVQVDFASRECQEAFFERLEKQVGGVLVVDGRTTVGVGSVFDDAVVVTGGRTSRSFEATVAVTRYSRYESSSSRPRTSSYGGSRSAPASAAAGHQSPSAVSVVGVVGSATPRSSERSSRGGTGRRCFDYYAAAAVGDDYAPLDRHLFRSYDEYSQASSASHDDLYDHEYGFVHDSPTHLDSVMTFAPPEIRNLQKERVHLLEQLEECPSSGDELISPKKRLKLDLLDSAMTSDVIIEANRDHRKVTEVRRLSDTPSALSKLSSHHSRRPSADSSSSSSKHSRHDGDRYVTCKRRKTQAPSTGSSNHHHHSYVSSTTSTSAVDHHNTATSGSEAGGSRPGTPLCDERPENCSSIMQVEPPRRTTREREGPISLPLPKFASQIMSRGGWISSISAATKQQQQTVTCISTNPQSHHQHPHSTTVPAPLSSPPGRSNAAPRPPSPAHLHVVPPPASPPPRRPSSGGTSSDSDGAASPPSPSLEERIRSLDEKYERWSGSRVASGNNGTVTGDLEACLERFRQRHKLLDLDLKEIQPSEIVKSVLAKRSVFDEDLKRLENVNEKYEPRDFGLFTNRLTGGGGTTTCTSITASTTDSSTTSTPSVALKLSTLVGGLPAGQVTTATVATASTVLATGQQTPPQGVMSPRATPGSSLPAPAAKGLQYPFPTHPPLLIAPAPPPMPPQPISATPISTATPTIVTIPPIASNVVTTQTTLSTAPTTVAGTFYFPGEIRLKPCPAAATSAPMPAPVNRTSSTEKPPTNIPLTSAEVNRAVRETKSSDKVTSRRDSGNGSSPRGAGEIAKRRNSDSARRAEPTESAAAERERAQSEERKKERLEKIRMENEKLEKERLERERAEREKQEKERAEKERLEKERLEREHELEKQRLEKETLEKQRLEKERIEQARLEKERIEKQRQENERLEKDRIEKERIEKERVERERIEKERKEKKEREEKERRDREEQSRQEKELREKEELEKREKEERDRRERQDEEAKAAAKERQEKERRHKEDNQDNKRKDDHSKHSDSSSRHKENSLDKHTKDSTTSNTTLHSHGGDKVKHHFEKERSKESIKENRDNNVHEKHRSEGNNRGIIESRHMSIELDKSRLSYETKDNSKRKERNNSLPASLGSKRRLSVHESVESIEENKKIKLSHEHKKVCERRDSKDSTRSEDKSKSKHKNNVNKTHDKSRDEEKRKDKDKEREERHKKHKQEKQKSKSKSREKDTTMAIATARESPNTLNSPITDKDFMARLDLRSNEDIEKQKREAKEKQHIEDKEIKDDKQKKPCEKHNPDKPKNRSLEEPKTEDKKKKERLKSESESDEPRKHSIFDIVDDEPAYISMYDKVKARSCKNMAKQEEEKRQEKIKAKFSQLKQSRAKREEKKRSTSWDEDSDSERDHTEVKMKRCQKMLIDSSDDESQERKHAKKKEIYTDSDSSAVMKHIKQEPIDTSEDEIKDKNKHLALKNIKSTIAGDTSEDECNKKKIQIKTELFSDAENTEIHEMSDDKLHLTKIKDEMERLIKKERRNSKHQEAVKINESNSTTVVNFVDKNIPEEREKFNYRHSFVDNTSDEEMHEAAKKEKAERREKKHKKKQKKQKHLLSGDETKIDAIEGCHMEEKTKHHERKKEHAKKEKRRDKTREGKEKSKKSKKNKDQKSDGKREGKMENIFGSLSEDSENGTKDHEHEEQKQQLENFLTEETAPIPTICTSEPDKERELKTKEKEEREREREEHKRRKEKKRREKERRLKEAQAAAEAISNENSMDFADMGKQLEANMMQDESLDAPETKTPEDNNCDVSRDNSFSFTGLSDVSEHKNDKEDRKEGKEKKKKRKKSKDERGKHHHHHHHDKNKSKSTEINKEASSPTIEVPVAEVEPEESKNISQHPSLPTLDEPCPIENKSAVADLTCISPIPKEVPLISPIPKTPTTSKEKKREKLIPGFGTEIDEKLHESAVKSISEEFEPVIKKEELKEEELQVESQKIAEEKPRVIISQEETEDAVAALLGESFGDGQYNEEMPTPTDQPNPLVEESIVQDDEEMRQAVQSLSATAGDLDVKPDTPQSEHELQIDTDTEEQDEVAKYEPKTPDIPEQAAVEFYPTRSESEKVPTIQTPIVIKTTASIVAAPTSPPSLTPIKSAVEAKKTLELETRKSIELETRKSIELESKSLPVLPEQKQVSVISQSWSLEKKLDMAESALIKLDNRQPVEPTKAPPLRQYPGPTLLKMSEPAVYKNLAKPELPTLTPVVDPTKMIQTNACKSPTTSQMHNLPARSPVQSSKPPMSSHDPTAPPKITTGLIHNRLPITPVMASKPMQATTVILQQSKLSHTLDPPKLVPTSERPRMVFQASPQQFANFAPGQPRMMIQGNIRHLPPQGLLVPTRQINPQTFSYLSHSNFNLPPVIKDSPSTIPPQDKSHIEMKVPPLSIMSTQPSTHVPLHLPLMVPKEQCSKPPTPTLSSPRLTTSTPSPKSYKAASPSPRPVSVPSSPVLPAVSPKPASLTPCQSPKISATAVPTPVSTVESSQSDKAELIASKADLTPIKPDVTTSKQEVVSSKVEMPLSPPPKSEPAPVDIVSTPEPSNIAEAQTPETVAKVLPSEQSSVIVSALVPKEEESKVDALKEEVKEEPPKKLAIEKVTEELNMSLKKELPEVKNEPIEEKQEEKPKTELTVEPKEEQCGPEADKEENIKDSNSDKENAPVEKLDEEKTETESIISDISKERSSADILAKDDPLDTKEDSDYWSAKEVNIDSVIKTLCSADELSDHSEGEAGGKDEWIENNSKVEETAKPEVTNEKEEGTSEKKEVTLEMKSDETDNMDESAEAEEGIQKEVNEVTPLRSGSTRGRGGRGRRGKATALRGGVVDRGGIQTRRGKLKELAVATIPAKRGRGGRPRAVDRKSSKTESDNASSTDVYEFRDESDDANKEQRPRLILTIKSPAVSSSCSAQTTAVVKEVTKDGAKEIVKEVPPPPKELSTPPKAEAKEDFVPPTPTNTRKSRRLQEKDTSRNAVDDTIDDVVKNTTVQTRSSSNQRRATRQGAAPKQITAPQSETPRKSPRGRKTRRGSEATETSSSEETAKEEVKPTIPTPPPVTQSKDPEPTKQPQPVAESDIPKPSEMPPKEKPLESLKAAMLRRIKGEMAAKTQQHEPTNLIDPVTGELIPMRECEEGRYIPLPGTVPPQEEKTEHSKLAAPTSGVMDVVTTSLTSSTTTPVVTSPVTPVITSPSVTSTCEPPKPPTSVIAQAQPITVVHQVKPPTLKAHVLSSQVAQAAVIQPQVPVQAKVAPVQVSVSIVSSVPQPPIVTVPPKLVPPTTPSKPMITTMVSRPIPSPVVAKTVPSMPIAKTSAPMVISKITTPIITTKATTPMVTRTVTPINQHLTVNTSLTMGMISPSNLSPRPNVPMSVASKPMPKQVVKPPVLSPVLGLQKQPQPIIQQGKQQPMVTQAMVNTQLAHMKQQSQQQPVLKQQVIMGKAPIVKPVHSLHQGQILTGAVPSPQSPLGAASRIIPAPIGGAKGMMEPPKVDVSMANIMLGQRPKLSPQAPQQRLAGMPLPGYEPSLHGERSLLNRSRSPPPAHQNSPSPKGEAVAHFSPGPLRPPPDLNPAHYMHPTHVMQYQQYLRQQQLHLTRTGIEKLGDGQEGEEAPVTSPPLELRRPGSVGLALTSRAAAVPHSLHSPHDRATDSPQIAQVYNAPALHPGAAVAARGVPPPTATVAPFTRYYDGGEPPPAHRPLTSHAAGLAGIGPPPHPQLSIERPLPSHHLGAAGNLMGAVARHAPSTADAPTTQRGLQAATPPHASQVPPQAESLFMLLKQYPCMWQGLLALKNDQAAVQMYFVSGNNDVAKCSLPKNIDGSTPPLRIFQRMRLEPPQVEGVARKMQMENEHCMLLALPCGHDHMDVLKQSRNLTSGFITYLQQKQAAGIINVAAPGTTQPPAYVVHIFPTCDFVNENLRRIAPSLLERVADIAHLLIVITTV
nr:unnamed protein product [Callosobruchus analis]